VRLCARGASNGSGALHLGYWPLPPSLRSSLLLHHLPSFLHSVLRSIVSLHDITLVVVVPLVRILLLLLLLALLVQKRAKKGCRERNRGCLNESKLSSTDQKILGSRTVATFSLAWTRAFCAAFSFLCSLHVLCCALSCVSPPPSHHA
jgi:hypothetical protein